METEKTIEIKDIRAKNKVKTARGVLLGYLLMIEKAKNTPFYRPDFSNKPEAEDALQKTFAIVGTLKRKLEKLIGEMDASMKDARFAEKVVRGKGIEEDEADIITMHSVMSSLNRPTYEARKYLKTLQESYSIMENLLQDKVTSVYHADFLVRALKELLNPKAVFYDALYGNGQTDNAEKEEIGKACRVMNNIGFMLKDEPYVKLRSLMCDMFGTGAVKEFEGVSQDINPTAYTADYDLSTEDGLEGIAKLIGQLSDGRIEMAILDYSDGMSQTLREVAKQLKDDKIERKGIKEAIDVLNSYTGEKATTAKECLEQVAKKEKNFRRVVTDITDSKIKGGNFLPVAGVGQVLNPLRYQQGTKSTELTMLQSIMKNAYVVYQGWQEIQDKLLMSARVLCGFARNRGENELKKQGGNSWFPDAMSKISANNVQTKLQYKAIVNGSLEELVKTFFVIENESSKLSALPVALISKNNPISGQIHERIEIENNVIEDLKNVIKELLKKDFANEISAALKDASIPVGDFHRMKTGSQDNDTPAKIAANHLLKFCKILHLKAEQGEKDQELKVLLEKKIKENHDFKNISLRVCEMCGFVPSNVEALKDGYEFVPKNAQDAYLEIVEELSKDNNADSLDVVLSLFEDYKPWATSYKAEVEKQVNNRKMFEEKRAVGYQEVLRNTCETLFKEEYKNKVIESASVANVLVCSLLSDAIMKDAGYRDKTEIEKEEMPQIARRLWDKVHDRTVPANPYEDIALELFLEPLLKNAYEVSVSKTENNLTKDTFDRVEIKYKGAISFVRNGAFLDFNEDLVMQSLGKMKEFASLLEGAKGNERIEDYAKARMKELVIKTWFPSSQEKYAQVNISGNFSAERQKSLFENLWEKARERNFNECSALLNKIKENNPYFSLVGVEKTYDLADIKEEIVKGNANLESLLREARWADTNAQFSERMGGTKDETKLKMSQRALDAKVAEIELAKKGSMKFDDIKVENKIDLVADMVSSVCKVFCSEIGYLVSKDIADGPEAVKLGMQIAGVKEFVKDQGVYDLRNAFMPAWSKYCEGIEGSGEYSVQFQYKALNAVCLDTNRKYQAQTNDYVWEGNVLYQMQGEAGSRGKIDDSWRAMLLEAGFRDFGYKNTDTYGETILKEIFTATKGKKGEVAKSKIVQGENAFSKSNAYVKVVESAQMKLARGLAEEITGR